MVAAAGCIITAFAPSTAPAQLNPFVDSETMDSANSGGTGGLNSSTYLDRARGAVDAANNAPSGQLPNSGGAPPPPPPPTTGGGLGAPPTAPSLPNFNLGGTLRAWGGERIKCHRTGQILQDAREISILATASSSYFDDGVNGNDAVAGDNTYTNITERSDYISPEAHQIKTKIIRTLQFTGGYVATSDFPEGLKPQSFRQVRFATTEPLSPLPKLVDLETERDKAVAEWAQSFLRDFRINPDQMDSDFYPTYLPPPPKAPNIPLPITYTPLPKEDAAGEGGGAASGGGTGGTGEQGGQKGSLFDNDTSGEPIGNASSRYF